LASFASFDHFLCVFQRRWPEETLPECLGCERSDAYVGSADASVDLFQEFDALIDCDAF